MQATFESTWRIKGPPHKAGRSLLPSPTFLLLYSHGYQPHGYFLFTSPYPPRAGRRQRFFHWNRQGLCNALNARRQGLWIPALSPTSYIILSTLLSISGPQCPHLRENNSCCRGLLGRKTEISIKNTSQNCSKVTCVYACYTWAPISRSTDLANSFTCTVNPCLSGALIQTYFMYTW